MLGGPVRAYTMPLHPSAYAAPRLLRAGHLQTILGALAPARARPAFASELLSLPDGDRLRLGWLRAGHTRLVILSHGLEGSMRAGYIRGMATAGVHAGWDVLAWDYRGCGGLVNLLPRAYHSGESEDLRHVIQFAAAGYESVALVGFSLGGNITLKYLGEAPPHPAVRAAAAISTPVDLASSACALDEKRENRLYQRRFLRSLRLKAEEKARRFPHAIPPGVLAGVCSIRDFDERFTAPLHGFLDAADYYARASSLPHLHAIRTPALLLNAQDDPLLAAASFPKTEAEENAALHLEMPRHGGHVGFLTAGLRRWSEQRVMGFLESVMRAS